jgi:hypothetical protein
VSDRRYRRKNEPKKLDSGSRKVPITIRIDRDLLVYLRCSENATATIQSAIRDSLGYRDWVDRLMESISEPTPNDGHAHQEAT